MKLYEITEQFKEVERLDDVSEEAIQDTLDAIAGEFEEKGIAVLAYILNEKADIEMLKQHKKDIDAKIKAIENRNERLREYLRYNMEKCGISKIESPLFSASLRKPSKVVEIEDENLLSEEFFKIERKPIKTEIAKALKAGEEVLGAKLVDGKPGLTIK